MFLQDWDALVEIDAAVVAYEVLAEGRVSKRVSDLLVDGGPGHVRRVFDRAREMVGLREVGE